MTETFASPADRIAAIESLPPEVRERLEWFETDPRSAPGVRWHNGERMAINATYADDMAILAEMEGMLCKEYGATLRYEQQQWMWWNESWLRRLVGKKSRFSAAVASIREVQK